MKKLLMLLFLMPLAFAAWQSVAAMAIGISVALLAVAYIVGTGFGINSLQIIAKEEFFQLIALAVMMVALVGVDSILNSISTSPAFVTGTASTMQESARSMISDIKSDTATILRSVQSIDMNAAKEASKSSQCNVLGMGYGVSACGGFTMLATPISMSGGILGFAMGELGAMERLILISEKYALTFLLPLGILLRTFKITRGAGGLLIALGISLHIMLPAGIIFNEMLVATFIDSSNPDAVAASADYYDATAPVPPAPPLICNPANTGIISINWEAFYGASLPFIGLPSLVNTREYWSDKSNAENAVYGYFVLRDNIKQYLFTVLLRATLGPVLALFLMAGSIKALTSITGAEVDVSAISRFV